MMLPLTFDMTFSKKKAPEYITQEQEIISKILHPYAIQGNECLA